MFKPTALYKVLFVCAASEALSDADLFPPFWALTVFCSYALFRDWKVIARFRTELSKGKIGIVIGYGLSALVAMLLPGFPAAHVPL